MCTFPSVCQCGLSARMPHVYYSFCVFVKCSLCLYASVPLCQVCVYGLVRLRVQVVCSRYNIMFFMLFVSAVCPLCQNVGFHASVSFVFYVSMHLSLQFVSARITPLSPPPPPPPVQHRRCEGTPKSTGRSWAAPSRKALLPPTPPSSRS